MAQKYLNVNSLTICQKTNSLQHLKKYWTKAFYIIKKVQNQWNASSKNQIIDKINQKNTNKIKAFLGIYQLLIVQFNEYCEALQIRDLGKCMLKIFIQINSIVESLLKSSLAIHKNYQFVEKQQNQQNTINIQSKIAKNRFQHGKRAISLDNNYYFATKQKNKYYVKQVQEEIDELENKYRQNWFSSNLQNMRNLKQKIQDLQPSNAENILRQACLLIQNKHSSLIDMIELRKNRLKIQQPKDYKKSTQILFQSLQNHKNIAKNNALSKIMQIVSRLLKERQISRKNNMNSCLTQTVQQKIQVDKIDNHKSARKQPIKHEFQRDQQIKNLKSQLKQQKMKNISFEKLLKDKTQNFQRQFIKQRAALLKQNQRASITSKISKYSQGGMDYVLSQKGLKKDSSQKHVPNLQKNFATNSRKSLFSQTSKKDRNQSKIRPSFDQVKKIFDLSNQKKLRLSKETKLSLNSIIFQFSIHTNNSNNDFQKQSLKVIHCQTSSQTQQIILRTTKIKQTIKQKPKIVKFKPQLQIILQFCVSLGQQQRYSTIINPLKQSQLKFNFIKQNQNSLRKKRVTVNWPINRTKNEGIIQQKIYKKTSYKQQKQQKQYNITQSLCINSTNQNCFGFNFNINHKNIEQKNIINQTTYKIKSKIPNQEQLIFIQQDINKLFLKKESVLNFEFLNYNMNSLKNKYEQFTIFNNEITLKSAKSLSKSINPYFTKVRSKTAKINNSSNSPNKITKFNQFTIQSIFKHLNMIKYSSLQKYDKLINFLRYPFSSIYNNNQHKWKCVNKQQPDFTINQLRKILFRLQKIHGECEKRTDLKFCEHIQLFLKKIGITIMPIGKQ